MCRMSADGWVSASRRLPLADEVRRDGHEDGEAALGAPEGELEAEEAGSGPGPGRVDPQGGRPPTCLRAASQLTCPERRRRTVEFVRQTLGQEQVSERRVCRVLGQNRGTHRHRPRKVDGDRELPCEHQAGASDLEGGAHAGSAKAAKTPEITGDECQWLRSTAVDAPEPCVELRLPHGADRGRPAASDSGPPTHHAESCSPTLS